LILVNSIISDKNKWISTKQIYGEIIENISDFLDLFGREIFILECGNLPSAFHAWVIF